MMAWMGAHSPQHLLDAWPAIRRELSKPRRCAIFTDFDGTLVRIRRRKSGARLAAGKRGLLQSIAARGDVVGIISGRPLDGVCRATGVTGVWYSGVHGFFLRDPNGMHISFLRPAARRRVSVATRCLLDRLRGVQGIVVEPKVAAVTVHYRRAGRREHNRARQAVEACHTPGLQLLFSKKAWELIPQNTGKSIDKMSAIRFILRQERLWRTRRGLVVYFGDDRTDETVFRALRGITVAVGKRRRTAARYYVNAPSEVWTFLERWSSRRL